VQVAEQNEPAALDPVRVLRRIAFLLERRLADSYRIKAYRGAAAALLTCEPDEVRSRAAAGTLRDLPGIGAKTESVVADCLAGTTPATLAELERDAGPLATGGETVRAALRGDLHTHSDWSDGGSPIPEMAEAARRLGHEWVALTDHSPRLRVAHGLSADRLRRQLDVVAALNEEMAPFRVLTGIEVDILDDGALDQQPDLLASLDVVVASVHSNLRMPRGEMTRRMVAAVSNPLVDVLGHCTGRLVTAKGRPESDFDPDEVFRACADHGVAVEINSRPERLDPPKRLLRLAAEAGCVFTIDSDAHAPGQLDWLSNGGARAEECGIPVDRILNTRGADEMLALFA
jgi:putative hydrolase